MSQWWGRSDWEADAVPQFGNRHSKGTITPELESGSGTVNQLEAGQRGLTDNSVQRVTVV